MTDNPDHHLEDEEYTARKGQVRVQVNSILSAICVGVLSVLLSIESSIRHVWPALLQLAVAVPLLVSSSLAYSKVMYRTREVMEWDRLAWLMHSMGYICVLNSLALMLHASLRVFVAWSFLATVIALFVLYSVFDVYLKPDRWLEKGGKLLFYLVLVAIGSIVPMVTL